MSILPIYTALVLGLCFALTLRTRRAGAISDGEATAVYWLLTAFVVWTGLVVRLGLTGKHLSLMQNVPLLWQALVPMVIWMTGIALSKQLRYGIRGVAESTPAHWLVLVQALRIGAIGGVVKGVQGEIQSTYVFWIGIPDFIFGLSAFFISWLAWRRMIGARTLAIWNLTGFALIVFPTFLPMAHWLREPGFDFIFEFPMILAPSIVVSLLISLNLLHAWVSLRSLSRTRATA